MSNAKKIILGVLLGILGLLFSAGAGLGIIALTGFPYSVDIDALGIEESSGCDRAAITENYNAMMEYLSPFENREWELPSLGYSESGKSHFEDCKVIFNALYISAALSFVALALLFIFAHLRRLSFRVAGFVTLGLPAVVGLSMALDFDRTFTVFHKLLFNNDDWIFDPRTDEIINILPEAFFMHCGILIVVCILLMAAFFFVKGYVSKRN